MSNERKDALLTIIREEVREILDAEDFGLRQIVKAKLLLGSAEKLVAALGGPIDAAEAAIEDDYLGGFRLGRPIAGVVPDAHSLSQNALREAVTLFSELMPALKAQLTGSAARAMIIAKEKGEDTIAGQLADALKGPPEPRDADIEVAEGAVP